MNNSALVNVGVLATLAASRAQVIAQSHGVQNADVRAEMDALKLEERKKENRAAAGAVLALEKDIDAFITDQSVEIAKLEADIAKRNALCVEVRRSLNYGYASDNYMPASKMIGQPMPANLSPDILLKVPKEWVAPVPVETASPAAATGTGAVSASSGS